MPYPLQPEKQEAFPGHLGDEHHPCCPCLPPEHLSVQSGGHLGYNEHVTDRLHHTFKEGKRLTPRLKLAVKVHIHPPPLWVRLLVRPHAAFPFCSLSRSPLLHKPAKMHLGRITAGEELRLLSGVVSKHTPSASFQHRENPAPGPK